MKGYCMKCRAEREIVKAKTVTMKNGRAATEGKCPACGTRKNRRGNTPKSAVNSDTRRPSASETAIADSDIAVLAVDGALADGLINAAGAECNLGHFAYSGWASQALMLGRF